MEVQEWLGEENKLGVDIFNNKYRFNNETLEQFFDRVSGGNENVRQLIVDKKFLFAGRTLSNRSTGKKASYSNCYSSGYAPDSVSEMMDLNKDLALTYKSQGGQGLSLSKIRPKGTDINGGQFKSDGIIPFMEMFNQTTSSISQGGSRKGALMMSLSCKHKEIDTFINIKSESEKITKANLSVEIDDEFMGAIEEYYKTGQVIELNITEEYEGNFVKYTITPINVYKNMMQRAYDWGEPGVIMTNRFRNFNLMELDREYEVVTGNPSMPKDVLVATTEGIVNINTLEGKEFYVKSLDGTIASAKCWLSGENEEVFDISFGGKRNTYATKKHKFPVLENGGIVRKEVSELKVGDSIPLNRNELQGYSNELTQDDGFLAGVFFAESSISKRKDSDSYVCMLSIGKNDLGIKERIDVIYNNTTNSELKYRDRKGTFETTITNKYFIEEILINKLGLNLSCYGKKIPNQIWSSGDNFVLGFIDGLFSSDGNVKMVNDGRNVKAQLQLSTSLDEVAKDIQILLGFYGVSATASSRDRKATFPNGKDYDRKYHSVELNIPPIQSVRFCNVFKLTCANKWDKLHNNLTTKGIDRISVNYIKIKSITSRSMEPVWDISVNYKQHVFPAQHCYTGNCGEQPLPKNSACNLGSLNLSLYVINPFTKKAKFDYERLAKDVAIGIEGLDDVLEEGKNLHALEGQREMATNYRNVGLGIMAVGDTFFKLGIKYGSEESKQIIDKIMSTMFKSAVIASSQLAKVKGSFPKYTDKVFDSEIIKQHFTWEERNELKKNGLRNCSLLSIAPSGSIGTMLNVTTGIEPAFQISYTRTTESLHKDQTVDYKIYIDSAAEYMKNNKTDILPDYFITSSDIYWKDRVDIQAIAQNHVDTAISSTVNLPENISIEEVEQLYLYAWKMGLKGITIYRDNCSRPGILTNDKPQESTLDIDKPEFIPDSILPISRSSLGKTYGVTIDKKTACGKMFITINRDKTGNIVESFVNVGKQGVCKSNVDGLNRLISLALRSGIKVEEISDQLKGISCASCSRAKSKGEKIDGLSCPDIIGRLLEEEYKDNVIIKEVKPRAKKVKEIVKEKVKTIEIDESKCPECESEINMIGGCVSCIFCGWSRCS